MSCARELDEAQRLHAESFARFETDAFRDLHHPESIVVLADGAVRRGADAILDALSDHFGRRSARCSWRQLHRFVDGCRVACVVYELHYAVDAAGPETRTLAAVTYLHERGRWLVIAAQVTPVAA
jgi:hypothetical protein